MQYKNFDNEYHHGNIHLYQMDCMELLKQTPDNYYELSIVDPPYGIGDQKLTSGGTWANKYKKGDCSWDIAPNENYFNELFRVSKNQIVWGGNYFQMPPARCYLVWDKVALMPTMADSEFAWTSFYQNAKTFRHVRNTSESRIHPTQKPVALYKWLLHNYAKPGDRILDTHGGSRSLAIACHDYGFDHVSCELDADYHRDSVKRFNNHIMQGRLL